MLQQLQVTGVEFVNVHLTSAGTGELCPEALPELWELYVTGKAWRVGMDAARITACRGCKRLTFPEPNYFTVDESRWDRTDFFNLDLNPNMVFVTERVAQALAASPFTNWRCLPV